MATVTSAASVTVVIVSYNTRQLLMKCLEGIDRECEIVVVDNASEDGSADAVRANPRIKLIENKENLGFGAANNQGIAVASRPLVLLLNSDAMPTPGSIETLASAFDDETVIAAGGMLMFPDGHLQESCANRLTLYAVFCEQTWVEKAFRRSRLFSPYWMSLRLKDSPGPVQVHQVMGACLMFRPVEQFDERFFLYCEDTELCERLNCHGKIVYVPQAKFHHQLGASSRKLWWKGVALYNCGKELYFRIHSNRFASALCFVLDRLGALLRVLFYFLWLAGSAGTNRSAHIRTVGFWNILWAPTSYEGLKRRRHKPPPNYT